MECSICAETFTSVLRKKIVCPVETCKQEICKKCVEVWLVERTNITCPCCNSIWSYKYALDNIGKAFLEKYKKVQKNLLLSMEKNFMEETQNFVEIEKELEHQRRELVKYEKLYENYKSMKVKDMKKDEYLIKEKFFEAFKTKNEITRYFKMMIRSTNTKIKNIESTLSTGNMDFLENADIIKNINTDKPVCPCPVNECKGYIKSFTYKCGMCETKICKDCNVVLKVDKDKHTCKDEDKLTMQTIFKESKPCPKCRTRIQKSEGCSQMYCTQCKTAFDYRTGKIETGRIHNPHYYEELRRIHGDNIPREPGDNPGCDDRLEHIPILRDFATLRTIKKDSVGYQYYILTATYMEYHRTYNHISAHLGQIRVDNEITFGTNFPQRFKYLKSEINEDNFKTYLYKRYKQNMYNKEIRGEIDSYNRTMFILTKNMYPHMIDINQAYSKMTMEEWTKYIEEKMKTIDQILEIVKNVKTKLNSNLSEICKTYGYKPTYDRILR